MREMNLGAIRLLRERTRLEELLPRNQCEVYVNEQGKNPFLVTKKEFDDFYRQKLFERDQGPYNDSFGDGDGDSYNPNRQAFGKLKDGRVVYCELSESFQEKTEKLFELMPENNID